MGKAAIAVFILGLAFHGWSMFTLANAALVQHAQNLSQY